MYTATLSNDSKFRIESTMNDFIQSTNYRVSTTFLSLHKTVTSGACPGGGGQGACPPPLEIEKQKKKVIRANIKLFHLYFATFLVENVIYLAYITLALLFVRRSKKFSIHINVCNTNFIKRRLPITIP